MKTIGKLNKRIKFAVPFQGRDDLYGGEETRYVESDEVWAAVEYLETKSDEQVSADQLSARTNTLFTIRTKTGLNTDMKVVFNGLYFNILSVLPQLGDMYTKIETVQIGNVRELGLGQDDGQNLQIGGGALTLGPNSDQSGNYTPPALTFPDGEGGTFNPV